MPLWREPRRIDERPHLLHRLRVRHHDPRRPSVHRSGHRVVRGVRDAHDDVHPAAAVDADRADLWEGEGGGGW